MSFQVPVLLIAFNRPEPTEQVLKVLQVIKPARLYVACDGARPDRPFEQARCEAVRGLIQEVPQGMIGWPCEVHRLFQKNNLGCRDAVTSALDWFFEKEPEGIVLEDDIIPDLSFFPYCEQLLHRFRFDARVGVIAANNHQRRPPEDGASYRFSMFSHGWGWATWRRAWACYESDLGSWPAFRDHKWLEQLGGKEFARVWGEWLDKLFNGEMTTVWDMIWQFSCWKQGFLTIIPAVELVENIGFNADATHTLDERSPLGPKGSLHFPLVHPDVIQADRHRDADTFRRLYRRSSFSDFKRKSRKALRLLGLR